MFGKLFLKSQVKLPKISQWYISGIMAENKDASNVNDATLEVILTNSKSTDKNEKTRNFDALTSWMTRQRNT